MACILVGETLALLSTTLRLNQVALWRARAAVNDIGAELASTADPETLWSSIALRLSDLVDLPDSDVYRLMDDGRLVVLASVYDEKPCPEQLHVCTARDVWGVDREALSSESRSSSPRPPIRASVQPSARTCSAGGNRPCSSCRWPPGTR